MHHFVLDHKNAGRLDDAIALVVEIAWQHGSDQTFGDAAAPQIEIFNRFGALFGTGQRWRTEATANGFVAALRFGNHGRKPPVLRIDNEGGLFGGGIVFDPGSGGGSLLTRGISGLLFCLGENGSLTHILGPLQRNVDAARPVPLQVGIAPGGFRRRVGLRFRRLRGHDSGYQQTQKHDISFVHGCLVSRCGRVSGLRSAASKGPHRKRSIRGRPPGD